MGRRYAHCTPAQEEDMAERARLRQIVETMAVPGHAISLDGHLPQGQSPHEWTALCACRRWLAGPFLGEPGHDVAVSEARTHLRQALAMAPRRAASSAVLG